MQNNNIMNQWFNMLKTLSQRVITSQDFNTISNTVMGVCNSYGYPGTGISLGTNRIVFDSPVSMQVGNQQMFLVAKMPLLGHQGFADNQKEIQVSNQFAQHGLVDIIAPTVGVIPGAQPGDASIILAVKVTKFNGLADFVSNEALYKQWVERCKLKGVLVNDASKSNFENFGILNGKMVALDYPSFMATGRPLTCPACGGTLSVADLSKSVGVTTEGYECSNVNCVHSSSKGVGFRPIKYETLVSSLMGGQR